MTKIYCGQCNAELTKTENNSDRLPCPNCGSLFRNEHVEIHDTVKVSDHVGVIDERDGQIVAFRESERQGRITAADVNADGSLKYSITGDSPQGEEDTLSTCQQLIVILNEAGASWAEPKSGGGVEDCVAVNRSDPKNKLLIQVIRAVVSNELWKKLNLQGTYEDDKSREEDLAKLLKEAIAKKSNEKKIPKAIRKSLVLALDASRLPIMGFTGVIMKYRNLYQAWTKAQGFKEVWVVGPNAKLVQRLDTEK